MSGNEPPKLGDHFVLFFIGSARGQGALDLVKVFVTMDGPVDRSQAAGSDDSSDEIIANPRHPLVGQARRGDNLRSGGLPGDGQPPGSRRVVDGIGVDRSRSEAFALPAAKALERQTIPECEVRKQRADCPASARVTPVVLVSKAPDHAL